MICPYIPVQAWVFLTWCCVCANCPHVVRLLQGGPRGNNPYMLYTNSSGALQRVGLLHDRLMVAREQAAQGEWGLHCTGLQACGG
jgi:hypothetical protein